MKKYFFLALLAVLILLFSSVVLADTYVTNRFLDVKLDTDDLINGKELWNFLGTDSQTYDYMNVNSYNLDSTYVCGMLATEENSLFDFSTMVWTKDKALIKQSGTSLGSDLSGNYYACTGGASPGPCGITGGWSNTVWPAVSGASYGTGWYNQCGFGTCDLSKSNTEYRPKYDVLCNKESDGTGKWYICRDYNSCLGSWACSASTSTWTNCAASGKTCSAGSCVSPGPVPPCSATLSVSSSGTAPCTVSASVSGTGCDGQTFEIKDSAGNSKCTGVITAGSGSCSSWSISADTSYNLFIPSGSATPVDTKTASCGTPCSSYSAQSSCQSGGCYWCASPNTPGNTCVQSSSQCTPPASCSAWNNNAGNCNNAGGCYYCGVYGT